ncbi:MAG: histidine phosphatase family protein [Chloroflexi bacterium]|nr:histidine phosphatase family protein [Chloroflexota bacterium]
MSVLYVTRHGESLWNAVQRIQGQTNVPLSERGWAQAAHQAQRLRDEPVDVVFTSDLARARDTATCIAEAMRAARRIAVGAKATPQAVTDVRLHVRPALRERGYGSWEGRSMAEVRSANATAGVSAADDSGEPAPGALSPMWQGSADGETFDACVERLLDAWDEIESHLAAGATVLLVGHGASIRALMCGLMGTPAEDQGCWELSNCGLSRLEWHDGRLVVAYWDDCTEAAANNR